MSTTYHIWHNGQDHGPYTAAEMRGMLARGEMVGVLWRRTGAVNYQPHTDLGDELTQGDAPEVAKPTLSHILGDAPIGSPPTDSAKKAEPEGDSLLGQISGSIGVVLLLLGLFMMLVGAPLASGFVADGLGLISVSMLVRIHAKLGLIAHRLQR